MATTMYIRKRPRKSKRGTTFDFYVARSVRSEAGPRSKVCGYVACIEERFLTVELHRGVFWRDAHAKLPEIVAAAGLTIRHVNRELAKLSASLEKHVPRPSPEIVIAPRRKRD